MFYIGAGNWKLCRNISQGSEMKPIYHQVITYFIALLTWLFGFDIGKCAFSQPAEICAHEKQSRSGGFGSWLEERIGLSAGSGFADISMKIETINIENSYLDVEISNETDIDIVFNKYVKIK